MNEEKKVFVTPHHLGLEGLESAARAIEGLPGGFRVERIGGEILIDPKGRMVVDCRDPGFLAFAVEQQGYAKSVSLEE